jgi:hypothetical protein
LQVLELCFAPLQLGEKHCEIIHLAECASFR